MEKISVIIPTYNREAVIERSVRSVLQQTYSNLEVIIVDDGSTDNTEQVIAQIRDERIRYIKQENGGASSARNAGVKHATADLIAFQDSDDYWHPDKLEKQMAYWQQHPECDLIYCAFVTNFANGASPKVPAEGTWGELSGDIFRTLIVNNTIGTGTMLMKKHVFEALGGFDISLECIEDWDFALRVAEEHLIGYVDEILVDAYRMEGSLSSKTAPFYVVRCQMIAKYHKYLQETGLFNPVVEMLFRRAEGIGALDNVKKMLMIYLQEYMNA